MRIIFLAAMAMSAFGASTAPAAPPTTAPASFSWTNPLSPNLRDPQIFAHEDGVWDGTVKGAAAVGLEGPCVIKIERTYYCFYSSWGRGYEIGYATADDVRGPWTRYERNPIYGGQDPDWAKRYKHAITVDPAATPYRQVGHGSIFTGPDGSLWTTAHAFRKDEKVLQPHLVYDPLRFEDSRFLPTEPSHTPQILPTISPNRPRKN